VLTFPNFSSLRDDKISRIWKTSRAGSSNDDTYMLHLFEIQIRSLYVRVSRVLGPLPRRHFVVEQLGRRAHGASLIHRRLPPRLDRLQRRRSAELHRRRHAGQQMVDLLVRRAGMFDLDAVFPVALVVRGARRRRAQVAVVRHVLFVFRRVFVSRVRVSDLGPFTFFREADRRGPQGSSGTFFFVAVDHLQLLFGAVGVVLVGRGALHRTARVRRRDAAHAVRHHCNNERTCWSLRMKCEEMSTYTLFR
jgi:hypothetical protein